MSDLVERVNKALRQSVATFPGHYKAHPGVEQTAHMSRAAIAEVFDALGLTDEEIKGIPPEMRNAFDAGRFQGLQKLAKQLRKESGV
jgi:hypothetical protein